MNQKLKAAYQQVAGRVPRMGDVDRAIVTARRRRTTRAVGVPIAVAALVLVAAISVAAITTPWSDNVETHPAVGPSPTASPDAGTGPCPVGEERPVLSGTPESVVLGCAQLPDGRTVVLLSMQGSGGQCLYIVGLDNRARGCGFAPSALVPPDTQTIFFQMPAQRNESAPIEIFGATSAEVTTVQLSYTRDSSSHEEARAALIRVTNSDVLEKAGIAQPFGYFLAELPADTSHVYATALGTDEQRLGAADFETFPWSRRNSWAMITGPALWDGSGA